MVIRVTCVCLLVVAYLCLVTSSVNRIELETKVHPKVHNIT